MQGDGCVIYKTSGEEKFRRPVKRWHETVNGHMAQHMTGEKVGSDLMSTKRL
jgi:hypothetical protein